MMNPLLNPLTLCKVINSYMTDANRIWRCSREGLERYRDKAFRRVLKRALSTPMYEEKYRNIDTSGIKGIKDKEMLPVVTKDDFRRAFPDGLIPRGTKKERYTMISTSGSTGKPVTIFIEPIYMYKSLIFYTRALREYGLSWRKDRLAFIVDLSPGSGEDEFFGRSAIPSINRLMPLRNIRVYHVGDDPEKIMEDLNRFKPKLIGGYPDILKILAILKERGKGDNVKPEYIASSGAILDRYSRERLEETFGARVFETYGATECSPMAIECKEGNMHIQSDVVDIEFWNGKGEKASPGELAEIVITSLIEGGTPVIRYDGVKDLLVPSDIECKCGMNTPVIERIEGRKADAIILPDGRMIPPLSITGIIPYVMSEEGSKIVEQFQIVQEKIDKVNISVVFKECEDSEKERMKIKIGDAFSEVLKGVDIEVREVEEIKTNRRDGLATPPPVVVSKVRKV